ncbi:MULTISPECIES: hypothetical protein [Catenuloplanes]|uniref:DUF3592 domain-containing protein n=1 Tax=Catenuloplanes niger TaxID=587534 RepID=A0AAE3ZHA7_9ACTN|nr:hypothetical protein [Catenuloplanes niger]MDR7319954.1 hypothetical protein [Catenuloplanes niger]
MSSRETAHRIAWGLIALNVILGLTHAYEGLREWRFRAVAVHTEGRVGAVWAGPEWLVEFHVDGELHTARTDRLTGRPRVGDRIEVLVDPADTAVAVSPGMTVQDWSELPGLLAMHAFLVLVPVLVLRFVHLDREPPAEPPRPRRRGRAMRGGSNRATRRGR